MHVEIVCDRFSAPRAVPQMRLERAASRGEQQRFGSIPRPSMPSDEIDPPATGDDRVCLPRVFDEFLSVFACRASMCASE